MSTVADLRTLRKGVAADLATLATVVGFVLLGVAVFDATIVMVVSIQARTQEFAPRRAFGARTGRVVGIFICEGLFTGLAGGADRDERR